MTVMLWHSDTTWTSQLNFFSGESAGYLTGNSQVERTGARYLLMAV